MSFDTNYEKPEPTREEIESVSGPLVLEFGATWCGFCQGAQSAIREAIEAVPGVRHVKVGDGKGKLLGRSFTVKLWPTLIFLKEGQEHSRLVRPSQSEEIRQALESITTAL